MKTPCRAHWSTYAGLFTISLATLMYENLLTRIFSVTMWYHFAFMAVSLALFGMTVGAIIVYLFPSRFTQGRIRHHLAVSSLLFAISIVCSFWIHLNIPLSENSSPGVLLLNYTMISIPFIFSGINVCLMLTRFPGEVGRLYAADLSGAALGCILFIYLLEVTDGPTAVLVVAALAGVGAFAYASDSESQQLRRATLIAFGLLMLFVGAQMISSSNHMPLVRLKWVKGKIDPQLLHERWNSFSRVRVSGDPDKPQAPWGWGVSAVYPPDRQSRHLIMDIDSTATTVITAFDGNLQEVDFLKWDITNLAHHIRPGSDVLVVGTGGGRDILSALVFEQRSVTGVEINGAIIELVTDTYGDFAGHLDKMPGVSFVHDEARSYITRSPDKFDILQISMIDTWAATTSGAYVLTENSLYTLEAWTIFLERLTPDGILAVSRWYFPHSPDEVYRLTSLATAALLQAGIEQPRDHIVIAARVPEPGEPGFGVGTMLVSKAPFSAEDLEMVSKVVDEMQFELVLTPKHSIDQAFVRIARGDDLTSLATSLLTNLAPPTDDSPFFFHMLRLQDIFVEGAFSLGTLAFNTSAVYTLGVLLIIVCLLTFLCIVVPLLLTTKKLERTELRRAFPLFLFFVGIGFGFMLVEISQLQRLTVFLGHPTYGLSVVLFSLLLSGGIGSYLTQRVKTHLIRSTFIRLSLLLVVLLLIGLLTTPIIARLAGQTTVIRILVAVIILFPLGLFMGMAFPLGMKIASRQASSLTPWLWGINGATSVCASVLAVAISLNLGISVSYWTGFACYLFASLTILWIGLRTTRSQRLVRA